MLAPSGKTYWVTGAGSGIGRALVTGLCHQGHTVLITGRRREPLEDLADLWSGQVVVLEADVSDDQMMASLLHDVEVVQLDGIYLAAGVCEYIDLPDLDTALVRRVTDVNFHGVVNACKAALPLLQNAVRAGRRPFIAGIASMSTYAGFPRAQAYGSAKAAMSYFLCSLRADIGRDIDVTVINPGFVDTPLTATNDFPMPLMVTAEATARHILGRMTRPPLEIHYPARLHWLLRLATCVPSLWYLWLAPRISRQGRISQAGATPP